MALEPAAATHPNVHAWSYALASGVLLLLVLSTAIYAATRNPYLPLSFIGPVALGSGLVGVLARYLRIPLPTAAYPVLILAVALAANAPLLGLVL